MTLNPNNFNSGQNKADRALNSSILELVRIKSRQPKVDRVVTDILRIQKRNHFAEHLLALMNKPKKTANLMSDINVLRTWFLFFIWVAAISTTIFPILYAFSSWRSSKLGRILMLQSVSFALTMDLFLISHYGYPDDMQTKLWLSFIVLGLVAFSTLSLTYLLFK